MIDLGPPLEEQDLPTELQQIAELLMAADFTPPPPPLPTPTATTDAVPATTTPVAPPTATPEPTPLPPGPEPDAITSELQALFSRDIVVTYVINEATYTVTSMSYSGSFPQVDDVEAIYAREGLASGESYDLAALESRAISQDLRSVPTDAPETKHGICNCRTRSRRRRSTWRCRSCSRPVRPDQFDQSVALQNWLRTNVVYTEDVEFHPTAATSWTTCCSRRAKDTASITPPRSS